MNVSCEWEKEMKATSWRVGQDICFSFSKTFCCFVLSVCVKKSHPPWMSQTLSKMDTFLTIFKKFITGAKGKSKSFLPMIYLCLPQGKLPLYLITIFTYVMWVTFAYFTFDTSWLYFLILFLGCWMVRALQRTLHCCVNWRM